MPSTAAHRIRRGVVIAIGAVVILGLGVYGPATLLGPLPSATATVVNTAATSPANQPPALPETGASGVIVADGASSGGGSGPSGAASSAARPSTAAPSAAGPSAAAPSAAAQSSGGAPATAAPPASAVSTAGTADPVPLGGTTKVITALVVLAEHPIADGSTGSPVVITAEDYAAYVTYISESARAVSFITNESWSERDMLQAMLLGSSNNHSDALARWAFGTMDGYLAAAKTWLAANGMTGTTVADATGLSGDSVGTASDLTRIAQLAFETPVIAGIMTESSATLLGNRQVQNLATYLPDAGVTGLSLSYTDEAGLCLLYSASVPVTDGTGAASTATVYGAMLREPDYPTLEADVRTLLASAAANLKPTALANAGDAYIEYSTGWGQSARGVAATSESRMLWATAPVEHAVAPLTLGTARSGSQAGSVTFALPAGPVVVPLELDASLTDPGPLWRLAHPVEVIGALIRSLG